MTTKNTSFRVTPAEKEAIVALLATIRSRNLIDSLPDKVADAVLDVAQAPSPAPKADNPKPAIKADPIPAQSNPTIIRTVDDAISLLAARPQRAPLFKSNGKL